MDAEPHSEPDTEMWIRTRKAVSQFRDLLLCSKCSSILTDPVCLGACEHLLCKLCAGPHVGAGCSVCHSPAWVKDIRINRQLSNVTELFLKLEALFRPPQVTASSSDSLTREKDRSVLTKKNFKIWFSPRSRKVRCRVENPVEGTTTPSSSAAADPKPKAKIQDSSPLSVFNFTSSQDSGSSTPPRTGPGRQRRKKRTKRSLGSGSAATVTRHQTKQTLRKRRLDAVNEQWGIGQGGVTEEQDAEVPVDLSDVRRAKRVSFQSSVCPPGEDTADPAPHDNQAPKSILKDGTPALSDQNPPYAAFPSEPPKSQATPNRKRPREHAGTPQTTPKRPKSSPIRPRSSGPAVPLPSQQEQREEPWSSPSSGRSQSSPAHMKRNHKGETPLHLAAIKGDVEVAVQLLQQGADPNLKDHAGWTPLHEACNLGHLDVVSVLLQQGALLNTPGYENDSPLHDAVRNGHVAVARLLLEHGASTTVLNIFGLRPADYAETEEMRALLTLVPEVPLTVTTPVNSPVSQSKIVTVMKRDVRPVLIGSKLTLTQQNQLIQAARALKGKRLDTFSTAVSHVVVPADAPLPSTLTVMQGLLHGCWILTLPWLDESLRQNRWVDEAGFEVDEAPQRARVNRVSLLPPLFDGCFFYLHGSFQKPPKDELVQLVRAGGGQLLTRQPKADSDVTQTSNTAAYHAPPDSDQAFCTHYVLYESPTTPRPGPRRLGKVWAAPSSWLVDCIMSFSLLPVPDL